MEKILVLDTETCGNVNIDDSFCYDISFIVCDMLGNIYDKFAFVVADYFLDDEMMNTAYYKDKMPKYWEDIENGTRELKRLNTIRHILHTVCKENDIHKMYAYNVKFDYDVLLKSTRLTNSSKYRYFLPYNMEIMDILKYGYMLARETEYKKFCQENGYLTKNGRPQTKAEVVARYLFDNNFQEEHKGLEDCEIEHKILCELAKRYPNIDTHLWQD